jgi:hypothetical protein
LCLLSDLLLIIILLPANKIQKQFPENESILFLINSFASGLSHNITYACWVLVQTPILGWNSPRSTVTSSGVFHFKMPVKNLGGSHPPTLKQLPGKTGSFRPI